MPADPRIDDYIARAAPFAQPILVHVRALVHRALPEAEEGIKWGMPHFMVGGRNIVGLAAFKAHAAVIVHVDDRAAEVTGNRDGMGNLGKLKSIADLPPDDELIDRIKAACAVLAAPRAKPAPKPAIPVPAAFTAAMEGAPAALHFFESLAPSHRREYIEWIADAKRAATRDARIEQAVTWLSEGEKRNWKYDRC